ncbi:hypothetical protein H9L39_11742 [Fusarium oxysporum f. sp. albedinis]|nr:hypothetical protein H9L39_11742 [Fusarium oxysporum f. sp. albedinis]
MLPFRRFLGHLMIDGMRVNMILSEVECRANVTLSDIELGLNIRTAIGNGNLEDRKVCFQAKASQPNQRH